FMLRLISTSITTTITMTISTATTNHSEKVTPRDLIMVPGMPVHGSISISGIPMNTRAAMTRNSEMDMRRVTPMVFTENHPQWTWVTVTVMALMIMIAIAMVTGMITDMV